MKIRHLKFLYVAVPLLVLLHTVGCDESDDAGSFAKPTITEVSPEQGLVGSTVTITGTQLKAVTKVKFGSVDAADFNASANTETTIVVKVPEGLDAGDANITVFYSGSSESNLGASASAAFHVLFPPVLLESAPTEAKPGKEITLSGNYLADATAVKFGDVAAAFTAKATSITAIVPELETGDVDVTVTTPGGEATLSFSVLAKTPEIVSFSPAEGKAGDVVTVNGFYFDDVQYVGVGATHATEFTVVSPTRITFKIPAGAASDKVNVTTALGSASSEGNLNVLVTVAFPYTVYSDALNANWEKWDGWGTTAQELTNTEHPQTGSNAIKITWSDTYGGFQLHPKAPSPFKLEGATKVKISIYGGTGSDGKQVSFYLKNSGGVESAKVQLTLVEGAYTNYEVMLSDLGNPADIAEFNFQNWGTAPITIFMDNLQIQ